MNHHTVRWHRELSALGHTLSLLHLLEGNDSDVLPLPTVPVRLPSLRVPGFSTARIWREAIASTEPDVVYMQWVFARPSMLAALGPAWPLVLTVMGSDVHQSAASHESHADRLWRTALLQRAGAITVPARPLAEVVGRYVPHLTQRVHVVPFGVDTSIFAPAAASNESRPFTIGHFKGDEPMYGRLELLRAVEPWFRQGRSVHLVFAGRSGPPPSPVRMWLKAHPHVAAHVTDHGTKGVDQMADLYRSIDVYVLDSEQESFGVAAAEALACEVPVVATRVGGIPTLVRSGDTGLLVDGGDPTGLRAALDDLDAHPRLRKSMGMRGRALVQDHFEMAQVARLMGRVIEETARKRPHHGGVMAQLASAARTWAGMAPVQPSI
ncbi:MAG: glycosyltransferase family 4 protein [Deltaproteobacteria bacterium]|nr:glycosyltransferase family 4 protein [Deltaproteobacteria bacterium]